jgi:hypothetical protein
MCYLLIYLNSSAVHRAGNHDAGTFDGKGAIDSQSKRRVINQGLLCRGGLMQVGIQPFVSRCVLGIGLNDGCFVKERIASKRRNFVATDAETLAANEVTLC